MACMAHCMTGFLVRSDEVEVDCVAVDGSGTDRETLQLRSSGINVDTTDAIA